MRARGLIILFLAACSGREKPGGDSSAAVSPGATSAAAPRASAPPATSLTGPVTEYGIGPLRAGMTIAEARRAVPSFSVPQSAEKEGLCQYATVKGLPPGVSIMVEDGIIGRVDVDSVAPPTAEGARVGDTEERVKALYPNRVTVSPHKYTDGHYLTVRSATPGYTIHRIVFETNNGRVTQYQAGRVPQVQYVEGCS
jgi:hypothetical protein